MWITIFGTVHSVKKQGNSAIDRGKQKCWIKKRISGPCWILILVATDLGSAGMYVRQFRKLWNHLPVLSVKSDLSYIQLELHWEFLMSPWQQLLSERLTARKEQKIIACPINAIRRVQATLSLFKDATTKHFSSTCNKTSNIWLWRPQAGSSYQATAILNK